MDIKSEAQSFFDTEVQELGEILDEFEKIKEMPAAPPEQFYPINRAARRSSEKRNRALQKRNPRG